MDTRRFDALARSAVKTPSRRLAIPAMLAALVGLPQAAAARKSRRGQAMPFVPPDISQLEEVVLDGKPLEQDGAGDGAGARAGAEAVGLRKIYFSDNCRTSSAVICAVGCPSGKQAIGGGVLDITPNGWPYFDRPGRRETVWQAIIVSLDGRRVDAVPFVVCLNK